MAALKNLAQDFDINYIQLVFDTEEEKEELMDTVR